MSDKHIEACIEQEISSYDHTVHLPLEGTILSWRSKGVEPLGIDPLMPCAGHCALDSILPLPVMVGGGRRFEYIYICGGGVGIWNLIV